MDYADKIAVELAEKWRTELPAFSLEEVLAEAVRRGYELASGVTS